MLRVLRLLMPPCIFLAVVLPVALAFAVLPEPKRTESSIPVLPADPSWYERARVTLREEAIITSPEQALRTLRLLMRTDRRVPPFCHGLAHEVGHASFRTYGFSGAVAVHDDICGSGYIHGIVEQALTDEDDVVAAAQRYCGEENPVCYHGVGHGFMSALQGDVRNAMESCAALPLALQRIKCSEGVFMEYFSPEGSPHALPIPLNTAIDLCVEVGGPYDTACAYYAPRAYLSQYPDDAAGAVTWCRSEAKNLRFYCMRGVGAMLMKRHIAEPNAVEAMCGSSGSLDEAQTCIAGMTSYWVVHHASLERGRALCASLNESHRPICLQTVQDGRDAYPEE